MGGRVLFALSIAAFPEDLPRDVYLEWTGWVMQPRYFFDDPTLEARENFPRYRGALNVGSDARAFAQGLARGGYATDPAYADKLARVAARLQSRD